VPPGTSVAEEKMRFSKTSVSPLRSAKNVNKKLGLSPDYVPNELTENVPHFSASPPPSASYNTKQTIVPRNNFRKNEYFQTLPPNYPQSQNVNYSKRTSNIVKSPTKNTYDEYSTFMNPNQFPTISGDQEKKTRIWLKCLNLTVLPSQESGELIQNPYRNGVILCELFESLENTHLPQKRTKIETVTQAQTNIKYALNSFQERRPHEIPSYYFTQTAIQGILRGDRNVIWGLLSHIRELYPETEPKRQPFLHLENVTNLPYSIDDLRNLEISLLDWLKSIGILAKLSKNSEKCYTILEIENELRNGTLFVYLAELLSKHKVTGTFKDPRSESTALVNLRKSFEVFRSLPKISHKWLWSEKEIFKGNRGAMFAVLEELHKFFDGVCDKEDPSKLRKIQPYIGVTREDYFMPSMRTFSPNKGIGNQEKMPLENTQPLMRLSGAQNFTVNANRSRILEVIPKEEPFPNIIVHEPKPLENTLQTKSQHLLDLPEKQSNNKEPGISSIFGSGSIFDINKEGNKTVNIRTTKLTERPPRPSFQNQSKIFSFSRICDITPKPFPATTKSQVISPKISQPSVRFNSTIEFGAEQKQQNLSRSMSRGGDLYQIVEWLEMIGTKLPDHFSLENPVLEEFKDGVLLCQIVGILEKHYIEGIDPKPTSAASAQHNIRKALEVLHKKHTIPLEYLGAVHEIYQGDPETIINLLKCIKKAYKNYHTHLEQHRNTIQIRSKILSENSREMATKLAKPPFGTTDSCGLDNTESLNTSLSKKDRKRFLLSPDKAWN